MIKTVRGDLIEMAKKSYFTIIIHGCNTKACFGAGIALQIKKEFPEAFKTDQYFNRMKRNTLGNFSYRKLPSGLIVINAYTQEMPGPCAKLSAIQKCFSEIKADFGNDGHKFGIPKIGCGLGGLEWKEVEPVIEDIMQGEDVTVVEYCK